MQVIENLKVKEKLYIEKLENGLTVMIIPKPGIQKKYVIWGTNYGSNDNKFVVPGEDKETEVPNGVAHFLEHKLFEQENGTNSLDTLTALGVNANAYTTNDHTAYLFECTDNFYEALDELMDYVQHPYFTDENVEKEKGIIGQEIKMYEDSPFYKIYDGIVYNSFVNHPIKHPIAGTVADIKNITKENLYTCYNTFYNPSNMFLVITGNVDPEETLNTIKANQEKKEFKTQNNITIQKYDEPNEVARAQQKVTMDVEISKIGIGYKIDCSKIKLHINDIKSYLSILFDLKLGTTSYLNERLKNMNLITHDLDISFVHTDKHILVVIIAETLEPLKVQRLIEEELEDLNITKEELERKKKVKKSSCIYRSDDIYSINNKIISNIINYGKVIYDDYKKIDEITIEQMKKIVSNITLSNKTIFVIDKS